VVHYTGGVICCVQVMLTSAMNTLINGDGTPCTAALVGASLSDEPHTDDIYVCLYLMALCMP